MTEKTYGQIGEALVIKYGRDALAIHRRWTAIGKGAKKNAAWMIGKKYI